MRNKNLILAYLKWEQENPLVVLETPEFRVDRFLLDKKITDKFYRVHCCNEDGRDETLGYFFDKEEAEKEARKAENEPRNKKYMITYHLEEID